MNKRNARTSNVTVVVILVLFAALAAVIFSVAGSDARKIPMPTSYSTHAQGLKALYELLDGEGFRVSRLRRSYASIPGSADVLVSVEPRVAIRSHEMKALRKWVEQGGTLITSVPCDQQAYQQLGFESPCGASILDTNMVRVRNGAGLLRGVRALGPAAPRRFSRTPEQFVALVFNGQDTYAGVARLGKGRIVALPAHTLFSNNNIGGHDNARLAYNVFAAEGMGAHIVFDEFHHGFAEGDEAPGDMSLPHALFGTPYGLFVIQLLAAALLYLLNRNGIKKRPQRMNLSATPLKFAEAAAGLYRRSGAHARSTERMIRQTRRDLVRLRRLPPDTTLDDLAALFPERDPRRECIARLANKARYIQNGGSISPDEAVAAARDIAWIKSEFEEPSHERI